MKQLVSFPYNLMKVCFRKFELRRIPQDCRRMIYGGQCAVLAVGPCSVLPGDLKIRRNDTLCGDAAKTDDDLRLQQEGLVFQIGEAGFFFFIPGITVSRRMAFQNIGNIDLYSRQ